VSLATTVLFGKPWTQVVDETALLFRFSISESCREEPERLKSNGLVWIGGYFRKVTFRRIPWSSLDLLQRLMCRRELALARPDQNPRNALLDTLLPNRRQV
jgi:hypothetical protein